MLSAIIYLGIGFVEHLSSTQHAWASTVVSMPGTHAWWFLGHTHSCTHCLSSPPGEQMILERRTVTLRYNHNCLSHGKSQARCPPFYLGLLQPQLCLAWCSSYASSCPQWRSWPTERDSVYKVNQQHGRDSRRKDILLDPGERHSSYLLELSSVVTPALSGSSLSHSYLFIDLSDSYLSMFSNLPMILSSSSPICKME